MNNETDLDWLARNVHEWREGANYICVNHTDGGYVFHEHNRNCAVWFTRDQWLARRAELQNKPSWKEAPEWARWLSQDADGRWFFYADTPSGDGKKGWRIEGSGVNEGFCSGETLGDWRDTLERRPQAKPCTRCNGVGHYPSVMSPGLRQPPNIPCEQCNDSKAEEFISVEDMHKSAPKIDISPERVQISPVSMHDWHERGELPPVDARVMHMGTATDKDWLEVEIIAHAQRKGFKVAVFEYPGGVSFSSATYFRPIRTEREQLTSIIDGGKRVLATPEAVADAILAAGFSLRAK